MGLEAAVSCRLSGFGVTVCEKGQSIGSAVKEWGHVRLFSANSINCSPHGLYATAGSNPNEDLPRLLCVVHIHLHGHHPKWGAPAHSRPCKGPVADEGARWARTPSD